MYRHTIKRSILRYKDKMKKYATIIMLAVAALLAACSDDDSFSSSAGNTLTFSTDTVKLDTVFSRVPSSTRTFWVYNNSGDGIRCQSVRLKSGNQTGLRVNVDGIYLGSSQGYQTNEIEIRKKDSIRVFVELTAPDNHAKGPQLLEDDLVFTLESGVQQSVNIRGYSWDADIYGFLEIHGDTTIAGGDKPIVIQKGLKVDSGATLTVAPGTTLYFGQTAGIDVYGRLKAEGTAEKNVVLRGDRIDNMFDYLPYDRVPGQWQGVRLHESSYGNSLNYTDLHSAYNGIVCDSSSLEQKKLQTYNTTIHNCQGYGLLAVNSDVDLWNCQITNTLNDCAAFIGGRTTIRYCTFAQFYPFDADRGAALRFANTTGGNDCPLLQFDVYNSLITGYADDVLMGDISDKTDANYLFNHCIIRTPQPDTTSIKKFLDVAFEDIKDTAAITGERHFKKIDADNQYYDFHLDKRSPAIGAAVPLSGQWDSTDRDGLKRDDNPDVGCYEYR